MTPALNEKKCKDLLNVAGMISGLGDFRQEKGKGNFGQFEVVTEKECQDIINNGGRDVQDEALRSPDLYDESTKELYDWYVEEFEDRGINRPDDDR